MRSGDNYLDTHREHAGNGVFLPEAKSGPERSPYRYHTGSVQRFFARAQRQDTHAALGDGNGMLELSRQLPVARDDRPAVVLSSNGTSSLVHHRLYGENHAFAQY